MNGRCVGVSGTRVLRERFSGLEVWDFGTSQSKTNQKATEVNEDIWPQKIVKKAPYSESKLNISVVKLSDAAIRDKVVPLLGDGCVLLPTLDEDNPGCVFRRILSFNADALFEQSRVSGFRVYAI